MTKITSIAVAAAAVFAFAACKDAGYKKTSSGLMYKIVTNGSGPQVKVGQFMKVTYTQKINDSLLGTSYGSVPAYAPVDSVGAIYQPNEVFRFLHKGDSVVILQMADTLLAKQPMGPGSLIKKGDKLTLAFKVEDVLADEAAVRTDREKEMLKENDRELAIIEGKLKDKKINATKTGKGTFVEIQNPGEGVAADSGKYVSVKYTGKVFATGKVFESNMEAGKEPISFVLGQHQVIQGWDEGLKLLKKGGKATLYIPGFLAYGPQPGPGGKPYESLQFDVELVDIADKAPAPKPQPGQPQFQMPQQGQAVPPTKK